MTVYTHGWYGRPAHLTDDLTLVGPDPGGTGPGGPQPPAAPTGLTGSAASSTAVTLAWAAATGATSYKVYRDGAGPLTVTATSATVTVLAASTPYTFRVAALNAGNGHTPTAEGGKALDCLTKKLNCGAYQTHGTWPALRGLMTWSVNWDRFGGWEFSRGFDAYFGG